MNNKSHKLTILGTGTSTGVPMPACNCRICQSNNPKNKRYRTSEIIHTAQGKNILIDAGPDLRSQVLTNNITKIDAVIITHEHADHIHGIDDLRPFCFGRPKKTIPVYASEPIAKILEDKFPYIFKAKEFFSKEKPILGGGIPLLDLTVVPLGKKIKILEEEFTFFNLPHGHTQSLCFIHGHFAHVADCSKIPPEVIKELNLAQLDILIIDCIRRKKHDSHLHLDQAIEYIEQIQPKFAGLTHLTHEFDHEALQQELSQRYGQQISPLFDGQILKYSTE